MRLALLAFLIFSATPAVACSFDTDCAVGSTCLKASDALYGICAGGMNPGNSNDDQPVYAPLDLNRSYGNTCSFDIDCGINATCLKSSGQLNGVCVSG